jgi:probable HAF family extracellular repeat protein
VQITDLDSTAGVPAGIIAKAVFHPRAPLPGRCYSPQNRDTRVARSIWPVAALKCLHARVTGLPSVFRLLFVIALLVLPTLKARADVITFDNLPDEYLFTGGGQNIGSYYPGVTFGPSVTGLDLTGSTAFPPPFGGSIVAWDPTDDPVTIAFADPKSMVGIWYTSLDPLIMDGFDSFGDLIDSSIGAPNTDGTTGESDFLSLTDPDIAWVTLSSTPGNYVFDDVTTEVAPELGTLFLLASALVGLALAHSFRRAAACGAPVLSGGLPAAPACRRRGVGAALVLAAGCCVASPSGLSAQAGYSFTGVNYPGALRTTVFGINNSSDVVGFILTNFGTGAGHGFVYSQGVFNLIDFPGATQTTCYAINDLGYIVGSYATANGLQHAFLLIKGTFYNIEPPASTLSFASGINNAGAIVGSHIPSSSSVYRGFLLLNGSYTFITRPGAYQTLASGINNANQIVGDTQAYQYSPRSGFVLSGGQFANIVLGVDTAPSGINDKGDIVGSYTPQQYGTGFWLSSTGALTSFGTNYPSGINNFGQLSGSQGVSPGFIATPANCAPSISPQPASQAIWSGPTF